MDMNDSGSYPRTIFIAGAARSGSTLLGEVLGAQNRVLNIGEISLFWRDADRGNRCACGEPISKCPLWSVALEAVRVTHGIGAGQFAELAHARARLAHTSRPMMLHRLRHSPRTEWPDDIRALVDATCTLVSAAAHHAAADVVVDASKTLPALLFLDLCGAEYDVLHLVRRAEAVAASTLRSRVVRRGNLDSKPPGGSLPIGVGRWVWSNACSVMLPRASSPRSHQRLHYEDFTADPEGVVFRLCQTLEIEFNERVVRGHSVSLPGLSHAAVGNPSRGEREIIVSEDRRWRQELSPLQARIIGGVTAPMRWYLYER